MHPRINQILKHECGELVGPSFNLLAVFGLTDEPDKYKHGGAPSAVFRLMRVNTDFQNAVYYSTHFMIEGKEKPNIHYIDFPTEKIDTQYLFKKGILRPNELISDYNSADEYSVMSCDFFKHNPELEGKVGPEVEASIRGIDPNKEFRKWKVRNLYDGKFFDESEPRNELEKQVEELYPLAIEFMPRDLKDKYNLYEKDSEHKKKRDED